jgi:hypothetical protein
MSLKDLMLEQLAIGRRIVADGNEVVPAWRINGDDGDWLILTRFDPDKPDQHDRAIATIKRFMVWKLAQSFILVAEAWIGPAGTRAGVEAITAVGASRSERLGVMQQILRNRVVQFGPMRWLAPEQMDAHCWTMLPGRTESISAEEIAELTLIFGEGGDFAAHKLTTRRQT